MGKVIDQNNGGSMRTAIKVIFSSFLFTLIYYFWSGTENIFDIVIIFVSALIVSLIFRRHLRSPLLHPKKIAYAVFYVFYLFIQIIKANIDVALRVIKPVIPINPGIVKVKTKLKTPTG